MSVAQACMEEVAFAPGDLRDPRTYRDWPLPERHRDLVERAGMGPIEHWPPYAGVISVR